MENHLAVCFTVTAILWLSNPTPRYLSKLNEKYIDKSTYVQIFVAVYLWVPQTRTNSNAHQQMNGQIISIYTVKYYSVVKWKHYLYM